MNRTPAKHAALRRIADGGPSVGLLLPAWPENTLDELSKAGLFTWITGECQLTEAGVEALARWDQEGSESPSAGERSPGVGGTTQARRTPARERHSAKQAHPRVTATARRAL